MRLQAEIRNDGDESWSVESGYVLSYQVYDAASDNLITEGPRSPLKGDVSPGESLTVDLTVDLPPTDGRYCVFVSPLREDAGWAFEGGNRFLTALTDVAEGRPVVVQQQLTTLRRLGWRRFFRTIGRAFTYPFQTITEHWSLIRSLVRRDIVGRYRGSYGGLFWTVIHPLLMMATYWFVFGVVLRARFAGDAPFVLYFLAGMLPWLAFSEAVGRAPGIVLEHANFVKKLVFPVEVLPVTIVFAGLFSEFFGLMIFLAGMVLLGVTPTAAVAILPLLLVPQLMLTMGLCWFFAGLGVIFRDLGQILGFVLTVWFFITPICYPEDSLPENLIWLYELNPIFVLVRAYRMVLLDGSLPAWQPLAWLAAGSAAVFLGGFAWFYKLRRSFADLL